MYSWEIDQFIKNKKYIISSDEYLDIIRNSPQIVGIKFLGENCYDMWTNDNYFWTFFIKPYEKVLVKKMIK